MPQRVLLCPPTHFQVEYAINPWMDPMNRINTGRAWREYRTLKEEYEQLGAEVIELQPDPNLPDMVFTANHGAVFGQEFIPANFAYAQRRGESRIATKQFASLGFKITPLPRSICFEGQGDLILAGEQYVLGWGPRTDQRAAEFLASLLGQTPLVLELVHPAFYHLDTCFASLGDDTVIITPRAFSDDGLKVIRSQFTTVIETTEDEDATLPCNLVRFGQEVIVGSDLSPRLRRAFESLDLTVHEVPTHEFRKSGGSVKCLTLLLDEVTNEASQVTPSTVE